MQDIAKIAPLEIAPFDDDQYAISKQETTPNADKPGDWALAGGFTWLFLWLFAMLSFAQNVGGGTFVATLIGGIVPSFLAFRLLAHRSERRRLAAVPAAERTWHVAFVRSLTRARSFNRRLTSIQQFASMADEDELPGTDVAAKYAAERAEIAAALQPLLHDVRVARRRSSLETLQRAIAEHDDGQYRQTRDVSDAVYVQRVRVAAEERELCRPAVPESPYEDEFRELEEAEAAQTDSGRRRA